MGVFKDVEQAAWALGLACGLWVAAHKAREVAPHGGVGEGGPLPEAWVGVPQQQLVAICCADDPLHNGVAHPWRAITGAQELHPPPRGLVEATEHWPDIQAIHWGQASSSCPLVSGVHASQGAEGHVPVLNGHKGLAPAAPHGRGDQAATGKGIHAHPTLQVAHLPATQWVVVGA